LFHPFINVPNATVKRLAKARSGFANLSSTVCSVNYIRKPKPVTASIKDFPINLRIKGDVNIKGDVGSKTI